MAGTISALSVGFRVWGEFVGENTMSMKTPTPAMLIILLLLMMMMMMMRMMMMMTVMFLVIANNVDGEGGEDDESTDAVCSDADNGSDSTLARFLLLLPSYNRIPLDILIVPIAMGSGAGQKFNGASFWLQTHRFPPKQRAVELWVRGPRKARNASV